MIKTLGRKGEGYIETAVSVIAAMMTVVIVLNIFSFITIKQDMDYFASQIAEKACSQGNTVTGIEDRKNTLAGETGISPEISFEGTEYFDRAAGKVQYGENISVRITYRTYVKGLGLFRIPVTLSASCSGLSRKYWK